ncbi:MAG: alpha/beta hydrolase [Kofleriaceae bacterium]|nr:alpha/beta hydrolase [Kofleriaceae bacterium]
MQFSHQSIAVRDHELHVVTSGDPDAAPYVFLHGWPQSWLAWHDVMIAAGEGARCIAIDLPGIGASRGGVAGGDKRAIAEVVHELVAKLGLDRPTLVGHDVGGMIVYAYMHAYADLARAVIVNTVIPGVDPWDAVRSRPEIWHFAFHTVPALPELLVHGHERPYFDFFFDRLSAAPAKVTPERRAQYADAYGSEDALRAGFDLYRAMPDDAKHNASAGPCDTPMLYLRGDHDPTDIAIYADGFRAAGIRDLETAVISGAGHFVGDEAPAALWAAIERDHRVRRAA